MEANSTMERIIPDELNDSFGLASLKLHLERYHFAGKNINSGRVLDIACGTGYGSYLLATEYQNLISEIVAVDISAESIAYAHQRYTHPRIKFIVHDALSFSDESKFDSIITLETIEHLQNPSSFVSRLFNMLNVGGVLIASAPVTPSTDINPYHLNDFTQNSFRNLFAPYPFIEKSVLYQVQKISLKDMMERKKTNRIEGVRKNLPAYYFSHPTILFARAKSLITEGFVNKYIVLALNKES
jgi:cyclopropane fatty-acyl-phospholipid synthase-like methyltransferase